MNKKVLYGAVAVVVLASVAAVATYLGRSGFDELAPGVQVSPSAVAIDSTPKVEKLDPVGSNVAVAPGSTSEFSRDAIPAKQPKQPISETYEGLLDRAQKGDSRAALDLSMALYDCSLPSSDKGKAILGRDYSTIPENPVSPPNVPVMSRAQVMADDLATMENFEKINKACEKVPDALKQRHAEFLVMAADNGDVEAQLIYAGRANPTGSSSESDKAVYRERATRYMEAAAKRCHPDGLSRLAMTKSSNTAVNGGNMSDAYAYALVYEKVKKLGSSFSQGYSASLTQDEKTKAESFAASFYRTYCGG